MVTAFKERDGTVNVHISGYITQEPKIYDKLLMTSVCYGKKKYMNVKVWKSDKKLYELAECLEKHDVVSVDGTYSSYTGNDGKQYEQVSADFITVLQEPPTMAEDQAANDGGYGATYPDEQNYTEEEGVDGELPF